MVAGPVGQDGVAVQLVFAREISGLEQELAPIPFPLTMGCTATKEIVHSNKTARSTVASPNGVSGRYVKTLVEDL